MVKFSLLLYYNQKLYICIFASDTLGCFNTNATYAVYDFIFPIALKVNISLLHIRPQGYKLYYRYCLLEEAMLD